ncbi:nuclear transport factor 2-like isoform X2 [Quercus lobata]|uniref:nuclear transport factor 2-like isoform X2 n=1 Tax=Quercus lobata TaxID=97700 RepID=UPI0012484723|nr:nuclear transport factor 2-like isoform X2 [Quercus lobata]
MLKLSQIIFLSKKTQPPPVLSPINPWLQGLRHHCQLQLLPEPPIAGKTQTHAIFVPNLPMNATVEQLEAVFNNFGPIKHNGIQVRSSKQQGTCFGFVEFESASSMQSAIELTMTEGGFLDRLVIEMITLGAVETSVVEILVEAVAMGRNEFERRGDFSKEVYKMIYKLQLKLKEVVL